MEKFLVAILSFIAVVREIMPVDVDWCSLSCVEGPYTITNTMCTYEAKAHSGNCMNIVSAMTNSMRKELLHLHNELREKIANGEVSSNGEVWPTSSNMRQMSWDSDLEKLALRWNQQCSENPYHDSCRRTPMFESTGQNRVASPQIHCIPSANQSFDLWVKEIQLTTPAALENLMFGNATDNLTQIIWANTYKLGCSAIFADVVDEFRMMIVVCNYGPRGNTGLPVYQRGAPCSGCSPETSCKPDSVYPHLCSLHTDHKEIVDIPKGDGIPEDWSPPVRSPSSEESSKEQLPTEQLPTEQYNPKKTARQDIIPGGGERAETFPETSTSNRKSALILGEKYELKLFNIRIRTPIIATVLLPAIWATLKMEYLLNAG